MAPACSGVGGNASPSRLARSAGDLEHQPPGPARVVAVGERRLLLDGVLRAAGLADLHELGTTARGQAVEGTGLDRELVGRQLAVRLELVGLHLGRARLEVDDDGSAEVVALDPVDPAAEPRATDLGRELELGRYHLPGVVGQPPGQPGDHGRGLLPLLAGDPAGTEVDRGEQRLQTLLQRRLGVELRGGRHLGDGVHQRADGLGRARGVATADVLEEPAQLAAPERLDLRRAHRDLLLRLAHGPVVGEVGQAPPRRRIGTAGTGGRQGRQPVGGRGPEVGR
jgi:hypothetical protein